MIKKLLAGLLAIMIICSPLLIFPYESFGQTAGDTLTVRVGYWGENGDYRVKAQLTKQQLEALPQQTNFYTNMTRVGTIMATVGRGPVLSDVINAAGIDIGSVRMIHLRTTDAGGRVNNWFLDFKADKYIGSTLYYYPNIIDNWEILGERLGKPLEGALEGRSKVDTILAIESYSTKVPSKAKEINASQMNEEDSYRLCAGQSLLTEGKETSDVSSNESAKWIFGIDVTLWGSPEDATGLEISLDDPDIMVGSTKKIGAVVRGQELFEDKVSGRLKWTSSNEKIAVVDDEGNVTILKEGTVTITATTENGISRSVTINGTADPDKKPIQNSRADRDKRTVKVSGVTAMEIYIGEKTGAKEQRPEMAENASALDARKADRKACAAAGICASAVFASGIVLRIARYRREV